jgi:SHS2 domain-containing protein
VSPAPAFEFVDSVTSDLSFVARGATLEEAFAAAAEALLAATLENPEALGREVRRSLALEEPDLELLLLRFLNELVYLRDAEQLLLRPERLRVLAGEPARLEADLAGERIQPSRHRLAGEVKAATAHRLRVEPRDGGWELEVTCDV